MYASILKGYLNGRLDFTRVGMLFLIESATRLVLGIALISAGYTHLLHLAIVGSVTVWTIGSYLFATSKIKNEQISDTRFSFPKRFFFAAFIAGLFTNTFMSFDVLLAKHFLSSFDAGKYAFLSLVGKMVFFFGSTLQIFIIPLVSKNEGKHAQTNTIFWSTVGSSIALTVIMVVAIGHFGHITMPILFGAKVAEIKQYLVLYAYAMGMFTISNAIIQFHLAKHHYLFPITAFFMALSMGLGIAISHSSIEAIARVVLFNSAALLFVTSILHILQKEGGFILRNIIDFISLFAPIPEQSHSAGKKRILILSWRDIRHKYAGGSEVFNHELAKRWVRKGASVTLFCGNDSLSPRYDEIDGIQIIRRGGFYMVYLWAFVYYVFRFRGRFDIIIDVENGIPFFSPFYAREKIYLVIHHVHQDVFRKSLHPALAAFATFMEIHVMPYMYRHIQVITVSPSTKREIEQLNLSTVEPEIIYCGVSENLEPGVKSSKPLFAYLGRLKYYKSINVFIKVAKMVSEKYPDARFQIAGEGEDMAALKSYASRIQSPVEFLGKISDSEKVSLYQHAWATVNPSSMEGWGITSIESNRCATPTIASNVPGLRDSVKNGHSGFLFEHGDAEALAAHIMTFIANRPLREEMSKRAYDWSRQFDWGKSAERFYELFEQK
jgi:glycosyltransferase involved in cell wall biosynthesis